MGEPRLRCRHFLTITTSVTNVTLSVQFEKRAINGCSNINLFYYRYKSNTWKIIESQGSSLVAIRWEFRTAGFTDSRTMHNTNLDFKSTLCSKRVLFLVLAFSFRKKMKTFFLSKPFTVELWRALGSAMTPGIHYECMYSFIMSFNKWWE